MISGDYMLIFLALLPTLVLLLFFYLKDKYEKEPFKTLFNVFAIGMITILPVLALELLLIKVKPDGTKLWDVFYTAVIVAGFSEEIIKYLGLRFVIWKNADFNEMYDGIIYGVFLSLGFATVENVLYVVEGGMSTALMRILTAVPAHALFGTVMGYYLGKAKFLPYAKTKHHIYAWFTPVLLHGAYDFIIMVGYSYLTLLLVPFMIYLWRRGLKHTAELIVQSPFKRSKNPIVSKVSEDQ